MFRPRRSSPALLRAATLCVGALALAAAAEFTPCPYDASKADQIMNCPYRGRLGNQLIQYAFCRLQAAKFGIEVPPGKDMYGPDHHKREGVWGAHFGARVTCLPPNDRRTCDKDNGLVPAPHNIMVGPVVIIVIAVAMGRSANHRARAPTLEATNARAGGLRS
jgi:hypothetical protein